MPLTLHHLNNSRSQRVIWLLEELELPYEIKHHQRNPETFRGPDDLRAAHPLAKAPILIDEDALSDPLIESGAILEYVVHKYGNGRLKPQNDKELAKYLLFLHWAEGNAMVPLVVRLFAQAFVPPEAQDHIVNAVSTPEIEANWKFLDRELQGVEYLAGDFSAADIAVTFTLEFGEVLGSYKDKYPNVAAYLERTRARPAYKRALEKGGRFALSDFGVIFK